MKPAGLLVALTALALSVCRGQSCKFRDHKVIPDVILEAPSTILKVTYPNGLELTYGKELTPTEVKDKPRVQADVDKDHYYTLALVDPDVPSRQDPKLGQWLHWLVVNIPGNSFEDGDLSAGRSMAEYIGSAPPEGSGLHRYVFLLYKQDDTIEPIENPIPATTSQGRTKFKIMNYATDHKLGPPLAGNFYLAQYDDYVPVINGMLQN